MPGWVAAYSSSGPDHGLEKLGLAAVGPVDGLHDHPGGLGDHGERGPGVAAFQEQLVGGVQDVLAGLGGLGLAAGGVVAPAGLDILSHLVASS